MGVRSLGNTLATFGYKFGRTGLEAAGAPPPGVMSATGGIISDYEDSGTEYRSHIFTTSGAFVVTGTGTVDYLIVGSGGGGGFDRGGGGGGGAFVPGTNLAVTEQSYTITINPGGLGGISPEGFNGGTVSFGPITVKGGGGGGSNASSRRDGLDSDDPFGGSGGGGAQGLTPPFAGGSSGTYGNDGGTNPTAYWGAGGGGAGGTAQDPSQRVGGPGSPSTLAYGPTNPQIYAGGGGAGGDNPGFAGGPGGGGDGKVNESGENGRQGLGGGGGGGGGSPPSRSLSLIHI